MLAEGDKAPSFTLPDQNGEKVKLSDLKGQTVVLYFYPRADAWINSIGLRWTDTSCRGSRSSLPRYVSHPAECDKRLGVIDAGLFSEPGHHRPQFIEVSYAESH